MGDAGLVRTLLQTSLQKFTSPGFAAAISTRRGLVSSRGSYAGLGHSAAPFDALNFGDHVGDEPESVAFNRTLAADTLGCRPFYCQQVHGTRVLRLPHIDANSHIADAVSLTSPSGSSGSRGPTPPQADASLCSEPLQACAMMVADCLPILLTAEWRGEGAGPHPAPRLAVAAVHAGWRGLAAGVLEATVHGLLDELQSSSQGSAKHLVHVRAWLGPCIGQPAFEVGQEVVDGFADFLKRHGGQAQDFFSPAALMPPAMSTESPDWQKPPSKFHAHLTGLARLALKRLGVSAVFGNDDSPAWCTYSQPALWFSHRRSSHEAVDAGLPPQTSRTGRMAAFVWCTGNPPIN